MRISDWSSDVCSSDLSRLAVDAADAAAAINPEIDVEAMQVAVHEQGATIAVSVTVDAGARLIRFPLVPMPSPRIARTAARSEEHTSELQSLMRISYAVFCLKKKTHTHYTPKTQTSKQKHIER